MNFEKIDKTKPNQSIELYLTKFIEITGDYQISNKIVKTITITAKNKSINNVYQLDSAIFCCNVIKNKTVYYLTVNLKELPTGNKPNHKPVILNLNDPNCEFEVNTGIICFTHINIFDKISDKITNCNIDIFDVTFNPKTKKGNIIVGNP
jgi:hypothetical protein